MSPLDWLLVSVAFFVLLYAAAVAVLLVVGRRDDARALAGFIPVVGQLDDAIVIALVFRFVLRGGGPDLLDEHWSGPPEGRQVITRLAYGKSAPSGG